MSFSSWLYVCCFVLCSCYAENLSATLVVDVETNETMKQGGSSMQTTRDSEFEEMKNEIRILKLERENREKIDKLNEKRDHKFEEMENEIRILKLERENREKVATLNEKLQQCEDKMMETNTELMKLIRDQRNINEEYSKCNLFLANCMAQTPKQCEKSQESTQLTVSTMDKLLKEFQVRQWMMTDKKLDAYIDLNDALYSVSFHDYYTPAASNLISIGADVDAHNEDGNTPLMRAANHGHTYEMVKLLLNRGASVNIQNNNGWTALMNASRTNSIKIIDLLMKHNADVHLADNDNSTALMKASELGNTAAVQSLLSYGAKVEMRDKYGNTSLILACKISNVKTAMVLLDVQQNLNIQNKNGETALMYAALHGDEDLSLVKKLINLGAHMLLRNRRGETALDYARNNNNRRRYNGDAMVRYMNSLTTTTPAPSMRRTFRIPEEDMEYY